MFTSLDIHSFFNTGSSGYLESGVASWVNEKEDYTYSTNSCSGVCGHYTQVNRFSVSGICGHYTQVNRLSVSGICGHYTQVYIFSVSSVSGVCGHYAQVNRLSVCGVCGHYTQVNRFRVFWYLSSLSVICQLYCE